MQNPNELPPQGGQYIPPPPMYQGGADIPPQSPYHYSPAPRSNSATAAYFLYLSTGWDVLLLAAALGFFLNLLNLIPVWQLDGSWILAPVSKWVYVGGYALVVLAVLWLHSVFLLIIAVFGISSLVQRFRQAKSPYYKSVPPRARLPLGGAWLAL